MSLVAQVSNGGRIVIPVEMRNKLGIKAGDQVLLSWSEESKELRIAIRKQRLEVARNLVKRYANNDEGSIVDELIKDRREAALHE